MEIVRFTMSIRKDTHEKLGRLAKTLRVDDVKLTQQEIVDALVASADAENPGFLKACSELAEEKIASRNKAKRVRKILRDVPTEELEELLRQRRESDKVS